MRFDLAQGFPLLTTKKLHVKSIIYELLWFPARRHQHQYLKTMASRFGTNWADENGDLGPVYGSQWALMADA